MKGFKYCVLVVDDDSRMRKALVDFLMINNCETFEAGDGASALEVFYSNNNKIDIILLDVMMPKMNGIEMLKELRETETVPVIMLTAKDKEVDQLKGLNMGADDYISKPYSPPVLLARIESVMRRVTMNAETTLNLGNLSIYPESRVIEIDNVEIVLTKKEYDLLFYFCSNLNIALQRYQILDAVWGFDYDGEERTVDTHIKQLRAKIKNSSLKINTVHKVGYKLEVESP